MNKKVATVLGGWRDGGEAAAVDAMIEKVAGILDGTDSGRDARPLVQTMLDLMDRRRGIEASDSSETPLADVLRMVV